MKKLKESNGQVLIETVIVFLLLAALLFGLFNALSTATQIFIWHQKINTALVCSLDERKTRFCLREFESALYNSQKKSYFLRLTKFKFHRFHGRPFIESELTSYLGTKYEIRKQISSKKWKI